MINSHARMQTPMASRYLVQFCKHFGHKLPVEVNDDQSSGRVEFPFGACHLEASKDALVVSCAASSPEALQQAEGVVESHLIRFAWREDLSLTWTRQESTA